MNRPIVLYASIMLSIATIGVLLPASAIGTYTIGAGEIIMSSISADTILLPAGTTAYWGDSITLSATTKIDIRGSLRDYADGAPKNINLISQRDVLIQGSVIGESGAHRANETANNSASGTAGADGADVSITWGTLGQFTLAVDARIVTGDGGHGANLTVYSENSSSPEIRATAGRGGEGGNLTLTGTLSNVYGSIIIGDGGDGGRVVITLAQHAVPHVDELWIGTGGGAGRGGSTNMQLPCQAPRCAFSDGGDGGAACSFAPSETAPANFSSECPMSGTLNEVASAPGAAGASCKGSRYNNGTDGDWGAVNGGRGGDGQVDGCDGAAGQPGALGGGGGAGGDGGSAYARGGRGGDGGYAGGPGGAATVTGGSGGPGGPGGLGGSGGPGGDGGKKADAIAGWGGNGLCYGGSGGDATSTAGGAGAGGAAGVGGSGGTAGISGERYEDDGEPGIGGGPWC